MGDSGGTTGTGLGVVVVVLEVVVGIGVVVVVVVVTGGGGGTGTTRVGAQLESHGETPWISVMLVSNAFSVRARSWSQVSELSAKQRCIKNSAR